MDLNKIWQWNELDVKTITNMYLYGDHDTPAHVTDRLRSKAGYDALGTGGDGERQLEIKVDMASYMSSGPGRYAKASESKVVQDFFNGVFTLPQENVEYTKQDLTNLFGYSVSDFRFTVKHFEMDNGSADYAERTYIYNQSRFKISDDIRFVVEGGELKIKNMAVHAFNDNFDLSSSSGFTQLGNAYVLEPSIDPYAIGRQVQFIFENKETIPTTTYINTSFTNDKAFVNDVKLLDPVFLLTEILGVVSDLEETGTIEYVNEHPASEQLIVPTPFFPNSGYIVYGSTGDDIINLPEYIVDAFAFGKGNGNDIIVTNEGNDTILGSYGSDIIYAGEEAGDTDILTYDGFEVGLKVAFAEEGVEGTVYTNRMEISNIESMILYRDFTDLAYGIEGLILTGEADTVVITDADLLNNYFIDGNGGNDTLDLSGVSIDVDADFGEAGNITFGANNNTQQVWSIAA